MSYTAIDIIGNPTKVGLDHLIVSIVNLSKQGVSVPFWTFELWNAFSTGNSRTWEEFMNDLYQDQDNFGSRVSKLAEQAKPILEKVEPFSQDQIDQMKEQIEQYKQEKQKSDLVKRKQKLFEMKSQIASLSIDPKRVVKMMRENLGEMSPEEEEMMKVLESDF